MVAFSIGITAILLGFLLTLLIDSRLHRQNILALRFCGGEELARSLSMSFYCINYWLFAFAIMEYYLGFFPLPKSWRIMGGLILFIGVCLRFWAMHSLGQLWSKRCIYVVGVKKVESGPYRWLKHPEYLARIFEGLGLVLMLKAVFCSLLFLPLLGVSAYRLAKIETRQIDDIAQQSLSNTQVG